MASLKISVRTGLAGLLLSLAVAAPAAAATVTVRAEGANGTTLPQVTVPSTGPAVTKDGKTCGGDTAAGALDRATQGDWDGTAFSFGLTVDRILADSYDFSSGRYWNLDLNNSSASVGVCDLKPGAGDEILFDAHCANATTDCFTGMPLDVNAPATVTPGQAFAATVREFDDSQSPATSRASAGATVTGGGVTATSDVGGMATVTLQQRGPVRLTATKGSQVRDETTVCVTDGGDGNCGSPQTIPGGPVSTPTPGPGGTAGPTADTAAPVSEIRGISEQQRFRRRKGPRTLRATVTDAGGIADVKLALTRKRGRRCYAFSGRRERFVRARCGRHPRFSIGDRGAVSFLLPKRLKTGRYVFDVVGSDRAGNREQLYRGRNRIVFRVR